MLYVPFANRFKSCWLLGISKLVASSSRYSVHFMFFSCTHGNMRHWTVVLDTIYVLVMSSPIAKKRPVAREQ